MTWTLKFWDSTATPPVSWNWLALGALGPDDFPGTQASDITTHINIITLISTLAATRLNAYGQDIRIGYKAGDVGHAFRGPIDDYILIDIVAAGTLYFFNSFGQLVAGNVGLTIMHELAHIYLPGNDPDRNATEATMNGANFDFRGAVINEQNAIAANASLTSQIQTSYYATILTSETLFLSFTANSSYSDGNVIDTTRLGTSAANTIDHSQNTLMVRDLLFGLGGDDEIRSGKGNDYVYAGIDNDKIWGGDGNDVLVGEAGNDEFRGERGDDVIWVAPRTAARTAPAMARISSTIRRSSFPAPTASRSASSPRPTSCLSSTAKAAPTR